MGIKGAWGGSFPSNTNEKSDCCVICVDLPSIRLESRRWKKKTKCNLSRCARATMMTRTNWARVGDDLMMPPMKVDENDDSMKMCVWM